MNYQYPGGPGGIVFISDKTRWKWLPQKTLVTQWLIRWWWMQDEGFDPRNATKKELLTYFKYVPYKLLKIKSYN